jgi:hypothetical protein
MDPIVLRRHRILEALDFEAEQISEELQSLELDMTPIEEAEEHLEQANLAASEHAKLEFELDTQKTRLQDKIDTKELELTEIEDAMTAIRNSLTVDQFMELRDLEQAEEEKNKTDAGSQQDK